MNTIEAYENVSLSFPSNYPNKKSPLSSVKGSYDIRSYIVAYSEEFPFNYSAMESSSWSVRFDGDIDEEGKWEPSNKPSVYSPK